MTKRRAPATVAQAMSRIIGTIGVAEAARVADRSERLVYLWSDPDTADAPGFTQAVALDAAHSAAGGEGLPLFETYGLLVDAACAETLACRTALLGDVALAAREAGDAHAAAIAVALPGSSERDVHVALAETAQARSALRLLSRRLKRFLTDRPAGVTSP